MEVNPLEGFADLLQRKRCTKCRQMQPLDQFAKVSVTRDKTRTRYQSWCRTCTSAHILKSYHADPNKRERTLKGNLKYMYGITLEEYTSLLEAQGGVCAICKEPEKTIDPRTKKLKRLVVDHNHTSGKVRGLLCNAYNKSLGFLEMKIVHLDAMLDYLQVHREEEGKPSEKQKE